MSPEQAAAERDIDGRSDIYSLGCVLFEMITGAPPFTGPSWRAVTARHINEPAPLLRTVRDDVPEPIERVVNRMLAKSPDDRFPNAAALLDALRKPESVKPPSARRWQPSRGMVIAAAAFLAAAALISFLVARG
jgi:serine/threonine-protein kinase